MKISEYIHSESSIDSLLITKYYNLIEKITSSSEKYVHFKISEDFLELNDIISYFKEVKDSIIFICSGDIDFPPPKKPYRYDKYFNKKELPSNYEEISYYEKIELEILNIIEKNNLYVVSHDVSIYHPRILPIPLGIYPKLDSYSIPSLRMYSKDILCYANFGIPWVEQWFGRPRFSIYKIIKDNPCITLENTCNNETRSTINLSNFYGKLASSKFAICPRGLGIDTYRLWDCLYLGCIPIVEKYEGHKEFEDLPILFIDSIDFYKSISEEILLEIYDHMMLKEYNYEKLKFSYWKERIQSLENSIKP